MASLILLTDFNGDRRQFYLRPGMNYTDLNQMISDAFGIDMVRIYVLSIFHENAGCYVEFGDSYLNSLRQSLPPTHTRTLPARVQLRRGQQRNEEFVDISDRIRVPKVEHSKTTMQPILVWLDEHIGRPGNYFELKRRFCAATSLESMDYHDLICNHDIHNLIRVEQDFDQYFKKQLTAFSDIDLCLEFIINNRSHPQQQMVFITSDSLGEKIVPYIFQQAHIIIYVLRNHFNFFAAWIYDFINNNVQMFDHDLDLLVRITRDLAASFVEKARFCLENEPRNARIYLHWAKKLYNRANHIDILTDGCISNPDFGKAYWMDSLIDNLDRTDLRNKSDDETDELGVACDEG